MRKRKVSSVTKSCRVRWQERDEAVINDLKSASAEYIIFFPDEGNFTLDLAHNAQNDG